MKDVYPLFAEMLEYPTPALADCAANCATRLAPVNQNAAGLLNRFQSFIGEHPAGRLEELYTGTFDLQAVCCPYVGYQLLGEDYARGMFMVKLKEHYVAKNFSPGTELPDHIAVILRFLSLENDKEFHAEMAGECLVPALEKMLGSFADSPNPYADVLRALLLILRSP